MSADHPIQPALFQHWQETQEIHDRSFHADIFCLPLKDRINHMALHFAKYVGRLARHGLTDTTLVEKTIIDTALITFSAANTLRINLLLQAASGVQPLPATQLLTALADPAGRLADAVEKMDHLEPDGPQMQVAVLDVFHWVLAAAQTYQIDLDAGLRQRRKIIRESRTHISLRAIA